MRSLFAMRPIRSGVVLLVIATGLLGYSGGCGSGDPPPSQVNNEEIPKGWQVTKQGMMERMKKMRKHGRPGRGANRP
jgi:hypothetical protein